ncbi:MFS transporter [Glutamicibacter sp. AOP5-A2-18]|uniref:MFS transporter n=1 Tax=Glutamicibacter sp. AOP5-A2-18 TaxID=3457656 RepID=UPI0040332D80
MTTSLTNSSTARSKRKLPLGSLLALAAAGFLTAMLETLPAGILPRLSADLGVSEASAGQTITVYAIGSIAGAIPIISATMGWPRKRLLVLALSGFVITSLLVAVSPFYVFTLVVRFLTGISAGVLWGSLAAYAGRLVPAEQRGRGVTIAMAGTPIALALGTPAGVICANAIGWRLTFVLMAVLSAAVLVWVLSVVPNFPGQEKSLRTSPLKTLALPGIAPIVITSVLYITAHILIYTYVAAFLNPLVMSTSVGAVLLVFGLAALLGLWGVGLMIDRHLRRMMIGSVLLFALGMLVLATLSQTPALVFVAVAAWGIAFGGSGSIQQTALTNAAGSAVDTAQAVLVTGWNLGIAAGGVLGGIVLANGGPSTLPWATLALLVPVFVVVVMSRRHASPAPNTK